jgi:hypothetical protein
MRLHRRRERIPERSCVNSGHPGGRRLPGNLAALSGPVVRGCNVKGGIDRSRKYLITSTVEYLRALTGNVVMIAQRELLAVPRCAAFSAAR